jgi:hypothetical protein
MAVRFELVDQLGGLYIGMMTCLLGAVGNLVQRLYHGVLQCKYKTNITKYWYIKSPPYRWELRQ